MLTMAVVRSRRRIFGLKMDEVIGEWRRLPNEGLGIYLSPNSIRVMK